MIEDKFYNTVILAALLHDIGKFPQRSDSKTANRRGGHPQYSLEFVRTYIKGDTRLQLEKWIDWALFEILVKFHHDQLIQAASSSGELPADDGMRALAQLVSDADTFSSLERYDERQEDQIGPRRRPLDSIFSQISIDDITTRSVERYGYRAAPLMPSRCFPETDVRYENGELAGHFSRFLEEFSVLPCSSFRVYYAALLGCLERYLWCLPSDTTTRYADISLYDHLKTTSAIAACLYRYHEERQDLHDYSRKHRQAKLDLRFRLVGGALSGIQKFLFEIASIGEGGVAKRLRSRSFYITALIDAAVIKLLDAFDLPPSCNLYSTGGKFLLVAPESDTLEARLSEQAREIESFIFKEHFGQLLFVMDCTQQVPARFSAIYEFQRWADAVYDGLDQKKVRPFTGCLSSSAAGWDSKAFVNSREYDSYQSGDCRVCHQHPATCDDNGTPISSDQARFCRGCSDDLRHGRLLTKARFVSFGKARRDQIDAQHSDSVRWLFPSGQDSFFCELLPDLNPGSLAFEHSKYIQVHALFDTESKALELFKCASATELPILSRFYVNYVPRLGRFLDPADELADKLDRESPLLGLIEKVPQGAKPSGLGQTPLTFEDIAALARHRNNKNQLHGAQLLGVLKADVDHLGLVFSEGWTASDESDPVTVSRYLTLSRMIDTFFCGWLEEVMQSKEEFKSVYAVYSGGDDLFLVGPWDTLISLAIFLQDRFTAFCANSTSFTLSAGIVVIKPNMPISIAASAADSALRCSKQFRNRVTLFDITLTWNELRNQIQLGGFFDAKLRDEASPLTDAFLYRLLRYYRMYRDFIDHRKVDSLRYVSLLSYDIGRNLTGSDKNATGNSIGQEERDKIRSLAELPADESSPMRMIPIPVFYALYRNRR
jgi:CRISPR-associated protein Csm1